jgi:hypothetical protein
MFGLSRICSSGSHVVAALDRVGAVHQDLGLDDRDESRLDAECGVARQRVGVGVEAVLRGNAVADGDDRPPLGEAGAQAAVLSEPIAQAVEALGDLLVGRARQLLGARVDFDAGNDALVLEDPV